jgi:hypothetical protein
MNLDITRLNVSLGSDTLAIIRRLAKHAAIAACEKKSDHHRDEHLLNGKLPQHRAIPPLSVSKT